MTLPSLRRPIATWSFLVDLVGAVTQPPADIARCDERVETLAADSRIGHALSASVDACRRAYASSAVVAACRRTVWPLVPGPLTERVRAVGCVAAVAAATTLMLRPAGSEMSPFAWVLPAGVAVIAVVCVVAAEAIARAIASYHS
jgi:hypothetical protein